MDTLLFVNACVRAESRTYELARHWLSRWHGLLEQVDLDEASLSPLTRETLAERIALCDAGDFDNPVFAYARQLAKADAILIAAPYWDLSFPASLKIYLEAVNVCGITFEYTAEGIPRALCRAHKLVYITTAGGEIISQEFGFGYIKTMAHAFWGISDAVCYSAARLDIVGADTRAILAETVFQIHQAKERNI